MKTTREGPNNLPLLKDHEQRALDALLRHKMSLTEDAAVLIGTVRRLHQAFETATQDAEYFRKSSEELYVIMEKWMKLSKVPR